MAEKYDFKTVEEGVFGFWNDKKILETIRERNKKGKKFYFLQGPPYTSGRLHMGHAWNNALKDVILRFKRMQGFNVWDRAGYDMHGLPTELKVMAKLNMKFKEEILSYGLSKFNSECRNFSIEMMNFMDADLKRIGITMDFSDSYKPIENYFMEGEWAMIKNAHKSGRLYLGERTLSWCPECASALAKHEQEYKTVEENSIFVKMKVLGKSNEHLVIWTTTPWTIPFNLAVMVNPELDYCKCKLTSGKFKGEIWTVAKQLAGAFIRGVVSSEFDVLEEFKGEKLEGVKYVHPFSEKYECYKQIDAKRLHTVLMSTEYVDTSAGTGLVHCAPGCGPEDYEVGYKNGLPPFNNINEKGEFPFEMKEFAGLVAKKDDYKFVKALSDVGALVAESKVEHEYAHCWRHHSPVIFRTTKQWFLKTEDLKEKILKQNINVHWVPKDCSDQFESWIRNLRDNSITKQRYWGNPAPIWVNVRDETDYIIIGSADELASYVGRENVPSDLHKPFIDEVIIRKDGKEYRRIPDVLDVWLDAGTASWNCLYNDPKLIKEWYPADFVLEAREQIRLWFYMLAICGELNNMPSFAFKNVYCHGMLTAVDGVKMSKSIGNVISPYEIIEKHGADTMRYYLCSIKSGQNISFSWEDIALKYKNLNVLWNVHNYVIDYFNNNKFDVKKVLSGSYEFDVEERFMLSKLNSTKKKVTELLDSYEIDLACDEIEELYLSLSRDYIKMIRDKSVTGEDSEKKAIAYVMYTTLVDVLKMFNLYSPFVCDKMYQNIKSDVGGLSFESISQDDWVTIDEKYIDSLLIEEFVVSADIITATLAAREKAKLGVRWPVLSVSVMSSKIKDLSSDIIGIIKKMTNTKNFSIVDDFAFSYEVKPKFKAIGDVYGSKISEVVAAVNKNKSVIEKALKEKKEKIAVSSFEIDLATMIEANMLIGEPYKMSEFSSGVVFLDTTRNNDLEAEGFARELTRRVQDARKKDGMSKEEKIILSIVVPNELLKISEYSDDLKSKVGATKLDISSVEKADDYFEELIKDKKFKISFRKVNS
jgi:isoleucyl-tRNA synthetase